MIINTDDIVSISEANRNFSAVSRFAREHGIAVIFKDSRPAYILRPVEDSLEFTDDEIIDVCAKRVMDRFLPAFEELAK